MEETSQSGQSGQSGSAEDWLAGAMVEAGGEIGPEPVQVQLEGLEFGQDEHDHLLA